MPGLSTGIIFSRRSDRVCQLRLWEVCREHWTQHVHGMSAGQVQPAVWCDDLHQLRCKNESVMFVTEDPVLLQAGKFAASSGQQECVNCPAGKYQPAQGAAFCAVCKAGEANPDEGRTSCAKCSTGRFQNLVEQLTCLAC